MPRAVVALCVALCAALLAHVAIDVAGDYLLAHDSYDAIEHHSRGFIASSALALALVAIGAALRAALADARGDERAFCALVRASLPASPGRFAGEILTLTFLGLLAMEALDAALAGQRIDDLADLLGGSSTLGPATAIACGLFATLVAWMSLVRLARVHDVIVRAIAAFVRLATDEVSCATPVSVRRGRPAITVPALARRLAGRAPPAVLPAVR